MKDYRILFTFLMVLLTVTAVLFTGCGKLDDTPDTTQTEQTGTEQTNTEVETTEATEAGTEPPRTPGMYRVTILPTANGTVEANCTEAKEGEKITLTVTPNAGYEITTLIVNGLHGEESFEMPAEDREPHSDTYSSDSLGDLSTPGVSEQSSLGIDLEGLAQYENGHSGTGTPPMAQKEPEKKGGGVFPHSRDRKSRIINGGS